MDDTPDDRLTSTSLRDTSLSRVPKRVRMVSGIGPGEISTMLTHRNVALAAMLIGLTGAPVAAATCNLTVVGAHVLDDAACTVTVGRGTTRVMAEDGSAIEIRRSVMSARLAGDRLSTGRRRRATSYGQVVTSDSSDARTCYFNQKAVLCVEQ